MDSTLVKPPPAGIRVPYVDLAGQHRPIKAELLAAVGRVIDQSHYVLGEDVQTFERQFANLCGVGFAVAVNSGTDALVLALRALGIGPGDEVITVPNSFVATCSAMVLAGARPVFVDVRDDYNMDPRYLEAAITPRTKAIVPVHLTGRPADMDPILEAARRHGLAVVEDCAQAVLAEYKGRRVGSFGAVGCFSLHPLKTLNACGDGGVLTTNDEHLFEQLKLMRNLGLRNREECVMWSGHSRLDTVQAALLLVKLQYLEAWTGQRRSHAAWYQHALAGIAGVRVPVDRSEEKAVYHTFIVQAEGRNELKRHLAAHGVETAIHYPIPIHLQAAAAGLSYHRGSFPVAERQAQRVLSLPIYPELSDGAREHVAGTIRSFYGG